MTSPGDRTPGAGRNSRASMKPKTAVFAPVPSASVSTAIAVHPGVRASVRAAYRKSCSRLSMTRPSARVVPRAAMSLTAADKPLADPPALKGAARVFGIENGAVESGQPVIVNFWDPHEHTPSVYAPRRLRFRLGVPRVAE